MLQELMPVVEKKSLIIKMNSCKDHVPIRTCVSCRSKKEKMELLRLIIDKDDRVVIDRLMKGKGRGIYLCNDMSCIERFLKNKGLGRFFRTDKYLVPGFNAKDHL